jgi:hypothetical protein
MTTPAIYSDVLKQLERDKVRYVVVSGVAVVLHGYVRPIADLDIVIDRSVDEAQRAMSTLTASGFVPSIPLTLNLLTVLRMFDRLNREVDVFVRYHIPFEELWSASEMVCVNDNRVRVASLEHVLRVKRLMHRPYDLQDIEGLLSVARLGKGDQETDKQVKRS